MAIVVILVVIAVVLTVGWIIFRSKPPSKQQLAVRAIIGKTLVHPGNGDTAKCSVKVLGAQWCGESGEGHQSPITTYLAIDCVMTVRPLKGTADKVITSPPPDIGENYRERIVLLSKGKEIGRVTIPRYYKYGDYQWRVREVFLDASCTPAN